MYYCYVLYSKALDRYYIGSCEDLEERLSRHLMNHSGFTGRAKDWEVVYLEEYLEKSMAQKRERQIKGWKSRKLVEALVRGEL